MLQVFQYLDSHLETAAVVKFQQRATRGSDGSCRPRSPRIISRFRGSVLESATRGRGRFSAAGESRTRARVSPALDAYNPSPSLFHKKFAKLYREISRA